MLKALNTGDSSKVLMKSRTDPCLMASQKVGLPCCRAIQDANDSEIPSLEWNTRNEILCLIVKDLVTKKVVSFGPQLYVEHPLLKLTFTLKRNQMQE
ncbi:hypothetical protein Ancab_028755 [Ancistrocladus abbreviatus]